MTDRCSDPTCTEHWPQDWPAPESMVKADPERALDFSTQLSKLVAPIWSARTQRERQAQREAGQVWWAIYDRYGDRYREECFSLESAQSYLRGGEEYGTLAGVGIELPDGTITTDWYDE